MSEPGAATGNHAFHFTFDGRPIAAQSGQSIGAALHAAGVRIFTRSFKYHRPRGLFCVSGDCPNCLMNVDGRPNVRTCMEPAREGQAVTHQNAWPSLDWDVLRVFDKLDAFLPVGFYYKRFHRPRWLWPIFEHVVRHIAGLGAIDPLAVPNAIGSVEHVHADVCVIGAGPAGLAAAEAAKAGGADVILLEREQALGGHRRFDSHRNESMGLEYSAHPTSWSGPGRVTVHLNTTAFGLYEGNLIGAFRGDTLLKVRASQIVVCTGGRQQPFVFPNNDLPGIMLGRGVLRLARMHGVRAGSRAVILTNCEAGHTLAQQLSELGIKVSSVVDQRATCPSSSTWQTITGGMVLSAIGSHRLKSLRIGRLGKDGTLDAGSVQTISCDLLCLASELVPANELLLMAGMRYRWDNGRWISDRHIPGVLAAGAAAGTLDLKDQIAEGHQRGSEAAALALGGTTTPSSLPISAREHTPRNSVSSSNEDAKRSFEDGHSQTEFGNEERTKAQSILFAGLGGKRFVCFCEDVTDKDIVRAIAEGFDNIETLKRYTTVNMGPCQGKMCGLTASALCAQLLRRDKNNVGLTTSRPPVVAVEMCVLAADSQHHPVRRTPLHHWHVQANARWIDAGQWKRPESYGDPAAEVRAVRNAVGLIDVSTLGKIEVVGPDAAELLERIYLNKWADLRPGRVRYGVMCTEEAIVFDDGVCSRLAADRFYLTATTGNAEIVIQWLEMWRDIWRLDATVLNRTAALGAMNLAGPHARALLARLTKLDLSSSAFPYMVMREAEVAGVACRLFRIGFVGELGYEFHCPSAQAWHLWQAITEAGREFGIRPFGVEAQRVLRLEKGHFIVGQDTDALSNPLEAGLDWLVRFDKPLFHGREPLLRLRQRGPRARLVGFHVPDGEAMPEEGCQIVDGHTPVGRVTSVRRSPTLGRIIGLAWVPLERAQPGERFFVRHNGRDLPAVVAALPFYDPDGKRLKS
jgi:sarcosine oxidase subunit alpha